MIKSRFIAFADILGFRSLVLKADLQDLAAHFDQWVNQAHQLGGSIWRQNHMNFRSFELKKIHFSDTVVLLSPPVEDLTSSESELITKAFFMGLGCDVALKSNENETNGKMAIMKVKLTGSA